MTEYLRNTVRTTVKTLLGALGYTIVPLWRIPGNTLAGLSHRPIHTVIDCGANEGQFARYISRFFPHATLYCFEPLDEPFQALSAWAATQNGRVKCFQAALGDQQGPLIMHSHLNDSRCSSLLDCTDSQVAKNSAVQHKADVAVDVNTLDAALGDTLNDMEPEIFLKLDVQGYEDRVLRGASRLLQRVEACLLEVNVDPLYTDQAAFVDLVRLMSKQGLVYAGNLDQCYASDGHVTWLDALFLKR